MEREVEIEIEREYEREGGEREEHEEPEIEIEIEGSNTPNMKASGGTSASPPQQPAIIDTAGQFRVWCGQNQLQNEC